MFRNYLFLLIFLAPVCGDAHAAPAPRAAAAPAPTSSAVPADRELHDWCNAVTLAIPQIKLKPCVSAALKPVVVKSVKGRYIMLREFKPPQVPAARVLVIGGIHGDELTSASIVFRWLEILQQPGNGAGVYHWRVIPVLNPDGLLARPPTRVNARGVDLNRNFPTYNWLKEAPQYWETKTRRDPRRDPERSAARAAARAARRAARASGRSRLDSGALGVLRRPRQHREGAARRQVRGPRRGG